MQSKKEAKARIKINNLLTQSDWLLDDIDDIKANVILESGVDIKSIGDDFENISKGFIDYLLLDDKNFPLCVLEAKRESIHPLSAKEQARDYAKGQNCRFIILSNGISHYLWDIKISTPVQITEFPTQESLIHRQDYNAKYSRPSFRKNCSRIFRTSKNASVLSSGGYQGYSKFCSKRKQ